jgi:sulfite reductase subunit B
MKVISKNDFNDFVKQLIEDTKYKVHGPKAKGDKFVFGCLESNEELRLDYDTTILPPKKYFLPQYETLLEFSMKDPLNLKEKDSQKPLILIGVHPYDIIAIKQMDSYYLDTDISRAYLKKRKNTILIGSDVLNVHDRAFFGSMGTAQVDDGYDLFITDLGKKVAIEIGTKIGEKLLQKASRVHEASDIEKQKVHAIRNAAQGTAKRGMKVDPKQCYSLLEKNYDSKVWEEQAEKCLACGTCTMVCPTCFCYDIIDEVGLKDDGKRVRTWDGCLLRQFTEVAGGEIFREGITERYRHRFYRKGKYLPDRLGFVACVGCGRCSIQCIPDIADPVKVINLIFDSSEAILEDRPNQPKTIHLDMLQVDENHATSLHYPFPATILKTTKLTDREKLFKISLDSGNALCHDPGQFVEVSLMGIGEAPISIASSPDEKTFDLVVRKVGEVTNKLHELKKGDKIGIRGPLGHGFDIEALKGKDILFIAAGLGLPPLRSLITYVLDPLHRKDYGKITILCGCREPCEVLYDGEIKDWEGFPNVKVLRTVDRCPEGECWDGDIGLITKLIPKAKFDTKNTNCIIVGPPVVYPYCIQILSDLGVPEDHIIVSLERRMKCGVGKCGHCQINDKYCCKDGPVFNYKDIKDLPEAFT